MRQQTDPFEQRMAVLDNSGKPRETDAAALIYARLRTARAAVATELGEPPPVEAVIAVFNQLCAEVQIGQGMRSTTE